MDDRTVTQRTLDMLRDQWQDEAVQQIVAWLRHTALDYGDDEPGWAIARNIESGAWRRKEGPRC